MLDTIKKVGKKAKGLFIPEDATPEEQADLKSRYKNMFTEGLEAAVSSLAESEATDPNQEIVKKLKKLQNQPIFSSTLQMQQAEYNAFDVNEVPQTQLGARPEIDRTAELRRVGMLNSRVSAGLTPGMGDDPIVVQEGMSEREASTFGVFGIQPRNRPGLLKRRNDSQAEMARSGGDRG